MTDTISFSHLLFLISFFFLFSSTCMHKRFFCRRAEGHTMGPLAGAMYVSPVDVVVRVIPTCQLSMQLVHRVPPYPTRFPPSSLAHAHVGARGRRAFKPARPRHAMVRRLVLGRRARGGGGHRHGLGGISDGTASGSRPQSRSPHWQPPPARRLPMCALRRPPAAQNEFVRA